MKNDRASRFGRFATFAVFLLFDLFIPVSCMLCFVTGVGLEIRTSFFYIAAALAAALFTFLAAFRRPALNCAAALAVLLLITVMSWKKVKAGACLIALAVIERTPGIAVKWTPDTSAVSDATGILILLTAFLCAAVALCLAKRISWVILPVAVLLLALPCLILPGYTPGRLPFIVMTIALLLLTFTNYHSGETAGKAALMLSLPVCALIFGLLLLLPPDKYSPPAFVGKLHDTVLSAFDRLLFHDTAKSDDSIYYLQSDSLLISETNELSTVGPRQLSDSIVMSVYTTHTGLTYLRGMSYGDYVNNAWLPAPVKEYSSLDIGFEPLTQLSDEATGYISVQQYARSNCIYTPYYLAAIPDAGTVTADAYIANDEQTRVYSAIYSSLPFLDNRKDTNGKYEDYVNRNYLSVPEDIRQYVIDILWDEYFDSMSLEQKCSAVTDYLEKTAVYDLDTPYAPNSTDFVLWFLQKERSGYCVHFASAATLMLRSLGIPARYVTGFCCATANGNWCGVAEKDAHAWVEYYAPGCGWIPLEATPAALYEHNSPVITQYQPEGTAFDAETLSGTSIQPYVPSELTVSEADVTVPVSDASDSDGDGKSADVKRGLLSAVMIFAALFILGAAVRPFIAGLLRNRAMNDGNTNSRALARWKYILRLSKAKGTKPDDACMDIALKARFSQHTISEAELTMLDSDIDELKSGLRQDNAFRRLYYRFILAII